MIRRIYSSLLLIIVLMFGSLNVMAQEIVINVSTKSKILPPQLLLYVSDPSQFFTVQLMNTTSQEQRLHLALQMEHVMPDDGLSMLTPERYQPSRPFVVPANGTYSLTISDMKNLFNHIPSNAMKIPEGLIDGYNNGSFGLLPEGQYSVKFSAYRWTGNNEDDPYLLSAPMGGLCDFTVCYNASSPTWLIPYGGLGGEEVCELNKLSPTMTWTKPTMNCADVFNYSYRVRIVEVLPMQHPDVAIDNNPVVYSTDVVAPMLTIPINVLNNKFQEGKTYAAQITAKATNSSSMNYVQINNNGKSQICLFRLSSDKKGNLLIDEDDDEDEDEDEDEELVGNGKIGRLDFLGHEDSLFSVKDYVFRSPEIQQPLFREGEVRRVYTELPIRVNWTECWYEGGQGKNPDNLIFNYRVQLFDGKQNTNLEEVLKDEKNIIYNKNVNSATFDSIPWNDIREKVNVNDYLVLRVLPVCPTVDKDDIAFVYDSLSVRDFTLRDHIGPEYFQCSSSVELDNTKPTSKNAQAFEDTEVTIGQYQMHIDQIEGDAEKGFTGKGRVRWDIAIGTAMVHVQFKNIKINNEDVVYSGIAETYKDPKGKMSNFEAVENIFTDLGIEDMLADNGVPYAEKITQGAKKTMSEKIDGLADYYSLIKGGKAIWDMLIEGKETDIYMPICMPKDNKALKSLNSSPVDIQVTTMKFAPTWATMDIIGEFTMPKSDCLASDLLVFGAPRLCISPDHVIPEAGTLALLSKFTVRDPDNGYECTFNAPTNTLEPTDGCYIAWKDYKFEVMGVDMDMKIPKLKKYDREKKELTEELPNLHIAAMVANWDDFVVDDVTMDSFEADALPGFTFTANGLSYDHSLFRNTTPMNSYEFPVDYDMEEGVGDVELAQHGKAGWEGFFANEIQIMMPKGLTSGGGDDRLAINVNKLLIDKSGVTLDASVENIFEATVGGFKIDIQDIGLGFVQSNFNNCYFDGSVSVPFLKTDDEKDAEIGFNCAIRKQIDDQKKQTGEYAYIFNTRNLNGDFNLDLFIAQLKLDQKQTYFLLEAEPDIVNGKAVKNSMKTKCELMMGGVIQLGGKSMRKSLASKMPEGLDINIPDVHFVGMRIANCPEWKSKYVDFQADIKSLREEQKSKALLYLTDGKLLHNGKKEDGSDASFFFHTGSWSLASKSKQIGPFEFTLEDFEFTSDNDGDDLKVGFDIKGKVALVKGIDISAAAHLVLNGVVKNASAGELGKMSFEFDSPDLKEIVVHAAFCGMKLDGGVHFYKKGDKIPDNTTEVSDGFFANIDFAMPGDLFTVHGDGGYFKNDTGDEETSFSWGWLHASLGSETGLYLGPCKINKIGGGFYMNCKRNPQGDDKIALPTGGLVGVLLEVGMASADGTTIWGNLTLNVVYNRKRQCLSNFTMTGNVEAVGGIINADMTLVYESTPTDRYLQLNITADAQLSTESMAGALDNFASNLGSVKEMMQQLAGDKFKDFITDCVGGLEETIGSAPVNEDPNSKSKKNNMKNQVEAPKAEAKISLDLKFTWMAGGTEYKTPKWHLYLGEPDLKKRCSITLIDFKSPIVTCYIGANAYLCVGNELPNDGQLPAIPDEIAQFLDGSSHGEMKSDNIADAQAARQRAMEGMGSSTSGGVMLGASATGKLNVDLGIIEGNIDAILGFDIAVAHYTNSYCANLKKPAGVNGWYGQGQLYAYLALALNLHFNLGFVNYDIPIASAGIGGLLKMGAPSPNYFQGKLRAKVELLGGMFKLDKSFEFDCGQVCQMFKGNPLDDFVLFDHSSLGDTVRARGWISKSELAKGKVVTAGSQTYVKKNLPGGQYVNAQAGLDQHFRMLDENELARIAANFDEGSEEYNEFMNQAKRTFIFRDMGKAYLFEYSDANQYKPAKKPDVEASFADKYAFPQTDKSADTFYAIPFVKGGVSTRRYLDLATLRSKLKPGKYYRLCVIGYAKELNKGVPDDPYTVYEKNGETKVGRIAWVQSTNFYFMTAPDDIIDDKAPLQDYVALAFPSDHNRLRSSEADVDKKTGLVKHIKAYLDDVTCPTIALTEDIRDRAFREGQLVWRLLNPMGKQIDYAENCWVEYDGGYKNSNVKMLNMEPAHRLNAKPNEKYILQLDYYTHETGYDENDKWQMSVADTVLMRLYVETLEAGRTWRNGVKDASDFSVQYAQPFIAQKITSATFTTKADSKSFTDAEAVKGKYYKDDLINYIGYMSNYAFPAGWQINQENNISVEVTTSESMLFNDPAHGGTYEGVYNAKRKDNVYRSYNDIRNHFVHVIPENRSTHPIQYPLSGWWHGTDESGYSEWDYVHDVDERISQYIPTNIFDRNFAPTVSKAFQKINRVFYKAKAFDEKLRKTAQDIESQGGLGILKLSGKLENIRVWMQNHRGQYVTEYGLTKNTDDVIYALPAYQVPLTWIANTYYEPSWAYKGMPDDCSRTEDEGRVWGQLTGQPYLKQGFLGYSEKPGYAAVEFNSSEATNKFTSARMEVYRVNGYDMNNGHYWVNFKQMDAGTPPAFTLDITNPLLATAVIKYTNRENLGGGSGKSLGQSSGNMNHVSDYDKSESSNIDYSQLENNIKEVHNKHKLIKSRYERVRAYWHSYQRCAPKLSKAADDCEKNALEALLEYSKESYNATKFNNAKNRYASVKRTAAQMNDSIDYIISSFAQKENDYSTSLSVLNSTMNKKITPVSDKNNKTYRDLLSLQDEANAWCTEMAHWQDSVKSSRDGVWYNQNGEAIYGQVRHANAQLEQATEYFSHLSAENTQTVKDLVAATQSIMEEAQRLQGQVHKNLETAQNLATRIDDAYGLNMDNLDREIKKKMPDMNTGDTYRTKLVLRENDLAKFQGYADDIRTDIRAIDEGRYRISGENKPENFQGAVTSYLKQVADIYTEKSGYYSTVKANLKKVEDSMKEAVADSVTLQKLVLKLPTAEQIAIIKHAADQRDDELNGRDPKKAEKLIAQLQDRVVEASELIAPFLDEKYRNHFSKNLKSLWTKIGNERGYLGDYDWLKLTDCYDHCVQYVETINQMEPYLDSLKNAQKQINALCEPIWQGLEDAGYSKYHEVHSEPRAAWNEQVRSDDLNQWVKTMEMDLSNARPQLNTVNQELMRAKGYIDEPNDYFLNRCCANVSRILADMRDRLIMTKYVRNGRILYLNPIESAQRSFNQLIDRGLQTWNTFEREKYQYGGNSNNAQYLKNKLLNVINDFTKAKDKLELVKSLHLTTYTKEFKAWQDSINLARRYVESLPADRFEHVEWYQEGERKVFEVVRQEFQHGLDARDVIVPGYINEMTAILEKKQIEAIITQAQANYERLDTKGTLEIDVFATIRAFRDRLAEMKKELAATEKSCRTSYDAGVKVWSPIEVNINYMHGAWTNYSNMAANVNTLPNRRAHLQNCISYGDKVIAAAGNMDSYAEAILAVDVEESMADADMMMNYIKKNLTSSSPLYTESTSSYNAVKTSTQNIESWKIKARTWASETVISDAKTYQQRAQEALNTLVQDQAASYLAALKSYSDYADGHVPECRARYNSSNTDISTLNTAYSAVTNYYTKHKNHEYVRYADVTRQNYATTARTNYNKVLNYGTTFIGYYNNAKGRRDETLTKKTPATTALNFIKEYCAPSSNTYKSAVNYYNNLINSLATMSDLVDKLNTNKQTADTKMNAVKNTYKPYIDKVISGKTW